MHPPAGSIHVPFLTRCVSGLSPGLLPGQGWTGYILNMTSQNWLTDADFAPESHSRSLWWHILVVIVPNQVTWTRNATLYITGGSNDGTGMPDAKDEDIIIAATLAMANNIVAGCLFQIPNEHIGACVCVCVCRVCVLVCSPPVCSDPPRCSGTTHRVCHLPASNL